MKIWLDGYVPPSLNVLLNAHWAKRVKMKHDTGWLVRKSVLGLVDDEHHTVDRENPVRRAVHVTVIRKKLLDEDNFWGGMKLLIDVLKENSLIYDDCPRWCDLSVHQETGKEIGTLVEIT